MMRQSAVRRVSRELHCKHYLIAFGYFKGERMRNGYFVQSFLMKAESKYYLVRDFFLVFIPVW